MTDSAASPGESGRPDEAGKRWAVPRTMIIVLELAGFAVAAWGLHAIGGIAGPVLFALVLTICVNPVRVWLIKRGVSRGLATGSVILVVFALLAGFIWLLIVALANFATLLPQFAPQLEQVEASVSASLAQLGFGQEQIQAVASGFNSGMLADFLTGLLGGVAGIVGWLVIVLTVLLLMGVDGGYIPTVLGQVEHRRPQLVKALSGFAVGVRRYMVVTTVLGLAQGAFNAIALTILQVPGALLWGMLSFLCSFIPNVGYFIAIIPPLVFGAFTGGWPTVVAIIVIYGLVNAVVQSVVQPRVVGNAVQLSQTITFVSVLFWAVIFGAMGAILAVPLTLLVRTIFIDADPAAGLWRPLTGDLDDTRVEMKADDVRRKAERKAAKDQKDWVSDEPGGE